MNTKILIGLILLTVVAIIMDCYAGYVFFLMTVMSVGPDHPFLYLCAIIIIPTLFFTSIIGICKLKRWGYNIFVALTLVFNVLLPLIYTYDLMQGYSTFKNRLILSTLFVLVFAFYFLKPSTRKLFVKKNSGSHRENR